MIEPEGTIQKDYLPPRLSGGPGYYNAGAAPTANDDVTQGFNIGASWYKDTHPYQLWKCVSNSVGSAAWREIPLADFRSNRALFDHYDDQTTSGTGEETLYLDSISARTLFVDGDKIMYEYAGIFDTTNNSTQVFVRFGSSAIFSLDDLGIFITADAVDWKLNGTIIRVSNTDVRTITDFKVSGASIAVQYNTVTGLDLASNPYDLELYAETATAGDITAKMGTAWFMPAAPVVASDTWGLLGDTWGLGGDEWAFNP